MRRWPTIAALLLVAAALGAAMPAATGAAAAPAGTPGDGQPAEAPLDSLIWISGEAAADSLDRYWDDLDRQWYTPLTPQEIGLGLTPAAYDSLVRAGDALVAAMWQRRPWHAGVDPVPVLGFNRVDGMRAAVGWRVVRAGVLQPHLRGRLGWAFGRDRLLWEVRGRWPLWRARPRDREGRATAAPWTALALTAAASRRTVPFGAAGGAGAEWGAFLYGSDPNHYFERQEWHLGLEVSPRPWLTLRLGGGWARHRPLDRSTDWSLLGDAADVAGNIRIEGLERRSLAVGLSLARPDAALDAGLGWHRVSDSPLPAVADAPDGHAWYRRLRVAGVVVRRDPAGGTWRLAGGWDAVDRRAPLEWVTWLGGENHLRGFRTRELGGDSGGWASLDWRLGIDPLRALHVPWLGRQRLQPILFVDYGHTYHSDRDDGEPAGEAGWRADVGIGLGKFLGLGERFGSLRLYAARPVGQGMGDRPWRVMLAVESR